MTPLEFIAHDIICIVKFNAVGGTATRNEIKRVTEYLSRLGKLPAPEPPAVRVLGSNPPPPVGVIRPTPPPNPPAVAIPSINGLPLVTGHDPATAPVVGVVVRVAPPAVIVRVPK